jgi:hypothetical protein
MGYQWTLSDATLPNTCARMGFGWVLKIETSDLLLNRGAAIIITRDCKEK